MKHERFLALDGLRGLAAIAVLLLHYGKAAGPFRVPEGYLAVDLFFLLSGFVLAHAYGEKLVAGMSFWSYLRARMVRLYPLYVLGTAIGVATALAIVLHYHLAGQVDWHERFGSLLCNLAFLPSFFHKYSPFPYNGPAWSLFYEMAASLAFALAAPWLLRKAGVGAYGVLLSIAFAFLVALAVGHGTLDSGAHFTSFWNASARVVFSFLAGIAFYRVWAWRDLRWAKAGFWAPALIMVLVFAARPGEWRPAFEIAAAALVFPLILWLGASARPAGLTAKLCAVLGDISYPLYALHAPMLAAAAFLWVLWGLGDVRGMAWGPSFALALALGVLCYAIGTFCDAPLRRWLNRRGRDAKPAPGLAPAQNG